MPMPKISQPPFRADHVGSLLRPAELIKAREDFGAGRITRENLRAIEDHHIRLAIKKREDIGLKSITDGDFRRHSWSGDFLSRIGGVSVREAYSSPVQSSDAAQHGAIAWRPNVPQITGKLTWPQGGVTVEDFRFVAANTRETAKVTMPSPSMLLRGGRAAVDKTVYPDMDAFFDDVAGVWRAEIMALADAGCRYAQIDDTNLAYLCDPARRERVKAMGEDPAKLPALYARLINAVIADRPADMKICVHLCRGNSFSRGNAQGGYEPIAEMLFNDMHVDGFFLEYDDARSGDFAPLRFAPRGALRIVIGAISSKFGELEAKDDIKRRIEAASKFLPLDMMCLSAQCGFASVMGGNLLSEDQQYAKLRHVVCLLYTSDAADE